MALSGTAAGSKVYIASGTGSTVSRSTPPVQADFEAMTWLQIKNLEDAGQVGDAAADITVDIMDLAGGRTQHFSGPSDAGSQQLVFIYEPSDAGQLALIAAQADKLAHAFKLLQFDGTIKYYSAVALDVRTNVGNARNVIRLNGTLGVLMAPVKV